MVKARSVPQTPRARAVSGDNPSPFPHVLPDGSVRHPERVAQARWRDPEDIAAFERGVDGRSHQRTVVGFRAIDPLDRLPCTADHWKAAARLRAVWERGSGVRTGGGALDRVDGLNQDRDAAAAVLDARRAFEAAGRAMGARACDVVLPVVLVGLTVADLIKRDGGGNPMAVQGRVMAGLDRLVEHYWPPQDAPAARGGVRLGDPVCPRCSDRRKVEVEVDVGVFEVRRCPLCSDGLAAVTERVGRWRGEDGGAITR